MNLFQVSVEPGDSRELFVAVGDFAHDLLDRTFVGFVELLSCEALVDEDDEYFRLNAIFSTT